MAAILPSLLSKSTSILHCRRLPFLCLSSSSAPSKLNFTVSSSAAPSRTVSTNSSSSLATRPEGQANVKYKLPAGYLKAWDVANGKSKPKSKKVNKKYEGKGDSNKTTKEPFAKTGAPKYSKAARRFYNEHIKVKREKKQEEGPQRLNKVLAAAGVASRRSSDEIIFQGKVTVNGIICKTPQTKVDVSKDSIYVNGNRLSKSLPQKLYFALNKPKGYICSCGEESKSIISLFDEFFQGWHKTNHGVRKPRLFTVGRLDVATTGLIIVTNDGDFAQRLSHPSSELSKEYIATIDGVIYKRNLMAISEGTVIDGVKCVPDFVEIMPTQPNKLRPRIKIVVHQGKNHEVREIVKNAGLQLYSLKRVRIGKFRLPSDLTIGKFVELKEADIKLLDGKSKKKP